MKNIGLLLVLFLCFGCEEQNITDAPQPLPESVEEVTLALANTRVLPPNDPNLDPDWNWEESSWKVYFLNSIGTVGSFNLVNPFFNDHIFGHADPEKEDMKAEDGWMLVARDFGTPTDAPIHPWVMLYNKFRGLLRVCILSTSLSETNFQNLSLSFGRTPSSPDLFTFTEGESQSAVTYNIPAEWTVAEFNLQGYDPSIDGQARFHLAIHDADINSKALNRGEILFEIAQPQSSGVLTTPYTVGTYSSKFWDEIPKFGNDAFKSAAEGFTRDAISITNNVAGLIKNFTSSGLGNSSQFSISLEADAGLAESVVLGASQGGIEVYLHPDANNNGYPKALNAIPWGVMNYTQNIEIVNNQAPGNFLLINPAIAESISTIEAGWIRPGQESVRFVPLSDFESTSVDYEVSAAAVRLIFANGDVVYNRIPVN